LAVGQTFYVSLDNGDIDTGSGVGVGLQNSSGDTLWQFFFNGGDNFYNISGATTDIGWTSGGINIEFALTGPTNYQARITPIGGSMRTINGTLQATTNSQSITVFRAWNWNAGAGSTKDVFFNNLKITSTGSGAGTVFSDSVAITRLYSFIDTDHDGLDDAWEMQHFGNLTTANELSDWDNNGFKDWQEFRAGTNPKDPFSFLGVTHVEMRPSEGRAVVHWPGAAGKSYDLYRTTNLMGGQYVCVQSNMPYIPALNVFTDDISGASTLYYWIGVK
jgi:hypothetical protein